MARGPQTDSSGQIIPREQRGAQKAPEHKTLAGKLTDMLPQIAQALPRHLTPERMQRVALTALRKTPKLNQCTPASFFGAVLSAAQLGLEVNTPLGHAYLIPYEDRRNRRTDAQLQIGYQGMIELAMRSGRIASIYAHAVRKGDAFRWTLGLEPTLEHTPSDDPDRMSQDITHVYAVARVKDGEPIFTVLSIGEVEARKARSRASRSGPWVTDYEAMALKTAVRALFRWLPKSAELAQAVVLDEAGERGGAIEQAVVMAPEVADALETQGVEALPEPEPAPDTTADAPSDADVLGEPNG